VDPKRQSVTEAGAYRALRAALAELHRAEQTLSDIERVNPDRERAVHLVAIRTPLAQLETLVQSLPSNVTDSGAAAARHVGRTSC
jgi:hypothetical protein